MEKSTQLVVNYHLWGRTTVHAMSLPSAENRL